MKSKKAIIGALVAAILLIVGATAFAANNSSHEVFGNKFDKEVFSFDKMVTLSRSEEALYSYIPEKDMYTISTVTENGAYSTYLDKNGDVCFIANDKFGNLYIDYPNDGKGAECRNSETLELTEPLEPIDDGAWQTADVDSTYTYNDEDSTLRGSALTEQDAEKIAAISIIHEDSVRIFESVKYN